MARATSRLAVPVADIGASRLLADLGALKRLIRDLLTGQLLGVGHFALWVSPQQINVQLKHFLRLAGVAKRPCKRAAAKYMCRRTNKQLDQGEIFNDKR